MTYSLAAKLTVYSIIVIAAYLTVWPSVKRSARSIWKMFYEWYYQDELATAREFNRLLRLDRLRRNVEIAEYVDGLGQHTVWDETALALDAPEEKGAA
jgi:hypothetical protein